MKKFYSMILFALIAVLGAQADTWTFNVNIPNAAKVTYYGNNFYLTEKSNALENVGYYTTYAVEPLEGYAIASVSTVTESGNVAWGTGWQSGYYEKTSFGDGDLTIDVQIIDLNAVRTNSFTLNVEGDIYEVRAALTGTFTTPLNLFTDDDATSFTFKYSPEYEPTLKIYAPNGANKRVYNVQCGKYNEFRQEEYLVPLYDGCVVNVEQAYPDEDITVTFQGATFAVTSYYYGNSYEELTLPADNKIIAKLDDKIALNFDTDKYKINYVAVNSNISYDIYGQFSFLVDENPTTVAIDASPWGFINMTVNVNDAAGVRFQSSYQDVALVDGKNEIKVSEKSPYITCQVAAGYEITAASVNGEPIYDYTYIYLTAEEGMVLDVTVKKKEYPYSCVFWLNTLEAFPYGAPYVAANSWTDYYYLPQGFKEVGLTEVPQEPYFNLYGAEEAYVYVNGEEIEPTYGTFYPTLTDNCIVRAYANEKPFDCDVTFEVNPDTYIYLIQDYVIMPTEEKMTCLNGTLFSIFGGDDLAVYCNDKLIPALTEEEMAKQIVPPFNIESGLTQYNVVVEDAETVISVDFVSGIENVAVDAANDDTRIYNLQGVMVGNDLDQLPAGLYIRGGKKIVK